jgi:hypothetical protein
MRNVAGGRLFSPAAYFALRDVRADRLGPARDSRCGEVEAIWVSASTPWIRLSR